MNLKYLSEIGRASLLAVAVSMLGAIAPAQAEVKISVEDIRGVVATKAQWQPLADYLTQAVGDTVTMVPLTSEKAMDAAGAKQVDFMLGNPAISAMVHATHSTELVATLVQPWGTQFAGVIFTTPQSGIKSLDDVRGKKLISHILSSAGGHLYQRYHLQKKGIEFPKDFSQFKEVPRQDDIVLSVKAGLFDVGFCRTGIIEDLVKKGKAEMSDFVILDKVNDNAYPFVRTTDLYPEWYMLAVKGTDAAVVTKIKAALLALKSDSKTAETANIKGFQEPLPIEPMLTLLKALKVAPFDK